VLKDELLARTFGADRTLGALADTSGELLASGEVLFTRNVNLFIGELTGDMSERGQRIAKTIDDAGVRASLVPDIVSREWSKFVCWLGFFSLSLTTRVVTWRYLSDPDAALLVVRLVRELAALAKAQGIPLTEDRGLLPIFTVLNGSDEEAVAAVHKVGAQYRANAPEHRMSSLQDLLAGRPLEIEETFGHALRKARDLRVEQALQPDDAVLVALEAIRYGDIIVMDCAENMDNGKTYTFFSTVAREFNGSTASRRRRPRYDYVMKADDDTYLRLPALVASLRGAAREDAYYGLQMPCDTENFYPFPPFMSGMGYALSWDLVQWVASSDLARREQDGPEDMWTGRWLNVAGKAKNRYDNAPRMYN